jgi:Flp pilus assembly protein TadD
LTKVDPNNGAARTALGLLLEGTGKTDEARAQYEQALAADPNIPAAANNLAWIYAETGGNLDMALQLAQKAKGALPDDPAVNDTLGWIYHKKGLHSLAIEPLKLAVSKEWDNPVYQYHLGMAYAGMGHQDDARAALEKCLALNKNFKGVDEARRVLATLKS